MSSELGGITNASVRNSIGNRSMAAVGLAIHGANAQNVLTGAASAILINGVFGTIFAARAEIVLATTVVVSAKDGEIMPATAVYKALNAKDRVRQIPYIIATNKANAAHIIEPSVPVAAANVAADYRLSCPKGFAPVGIILVTQTPTETAGVAQFQLGVSNLSGVARQTVTFHDVSVPPATIADLTV